MNQRNYLSAGQYRSNARWRYVHRSVPPPPPAAAAAPVFTNHLNAFDVFPPTSSILDVGASGSCRARRNHKRGSTARARNAIGCRSVAGRTMETALEIAESDNDDVVVDVIDVNAMFWITHVCRNRICLVVRNYY